MSSLAQSLQLYFKILSKKLLPHKPGLGIQWQMVNNPHLQLGNPQRVLK